jgi:hypothetical protein
MSTPIKWSERFDEMCEYKNAHGDCNVSPYFQDGELYRWVLRQRRAYRDRKHKQKSHLNKEQFDLLKDVELEQDTASLAPSISLWERQFQKLCTYKAKNGHTNVLSDREHVDLTLYKWAKDQQREYEQLQKVGGTSKQLFPKRIDALNKIGFGWEQPGRKRKRSQQRDDEEDEASHKWVFSKRGYLFQRPSEDHENNRELKWDHAFHQLCRHQKKYGDCRGSEKDNPVLSKWVASQRLSFLALFQRDGKRKMTLRRFEKLFNIGFEFFLTTEKGGDNKTSLGGAILAETTRRSATKGSTTTTIEHLGKVVNSLQKDDDDDDDEWKETYYDPEGYNVSVLSGDDNVEHISPKSAKRFRQSDPNENTMNEGKSTITDEAKVDSRNGNDQVAPNVEDGQALILYEREQRKWETKLELLKEYKEKYGTCKVPSEQNESGRYKGLRRWTNYWRRQIQLFRVSRILNEDRVQRLADIIEDWDTTNSVSRDSGGPMSSSRGVQYSGDTARKGSQLDSTVSGQQMKWEKKFELIREYKEIYGSCSVIWKHNCSGKFKNLQRWTQYWREQIYLYKKNPTYASRTMNESRLKRLTDLGILAGEETSCDIENRQ